MSSLWSRLAPKTLLRGPEEGGKTRGKKTRSGIAADILAYPECPLPLQTALTPLYSRYRAGRQLHRPGYISGRRSVFLSIHCCHATGRGGWKPVRKTDRKKGDKKRGPLGCWLLGESEEGHLWPPKGAPAKRRTEQRIWSRSHGATDIQHPQLYAHPNTPPGPDPDPAGTRSRPRPDQTPL